MLRDMRTRFGGTLWGYGVVVMWPCVHILMLIAIYSFQHNARSGRNSVPLFFATGLVPVLIFQYVSREVMKATMANKPLTYYPQVKCSISFSHVFSLKLLLDFLVFLSL